jgi:plasmid maintenance system antidote protein VapI
MSTVVTFIGYTPVSRLDGIPWLTASIEEGPTEDGDWTVIDTITLSPVDADPEFPSPRSFTTALGTDVDMWYRVRFFDTNGDSSEYTEAVQNAPDDTEATPYAGTAELARILKIRSPTADQLVAMERVLTTAALEIDSELGRAGDFGTPYPSLVVQVNLERAVEHWSQQEAAFGIIGLGGIETGVVHTARDTWDRHAHKLAPLKDSWGMA